MKTCSRCKSEKPETEFYWKKNGVLRSSHCKECQKLYVHENYEKNKEEVISRSRKRNQTVKKKLREWMTLLKNAPCTDCGNMFHFSAMQFDHVRGKKSGDISTLVRKMWSKEALLQEIEKCELVCANCHAIRTFERKFGSIAKLEEHSV